MRAGNSGKGSGGDDELHVVVCICLLFELMGTGHSCAAFIPLAHHLLDSSSIVTVKITHMPWWHPAAAAWPAPVFDKFRQPYIGFHWIIYKTSYNILRRLNGVR